MLGTPDSWRDHVINAHFVIADSDPARRLVLAHDIDAAGGHLQGVIHPDASVSPSAHIGQGVILLNGVNVHANARIGPYSIVNAMTALDQDVVLGEGVQIGPGVILWGGVCCDRLATSGAGVTARPNVRIGEGAAVGADAVVIRDVLPGAVVAGNPAQLLPTTI